MLLLDRVLVFELAIAMFHAVFVALLPDKLPFVQELC